MMKKGGCIYMARPVYQVRRRCLQLGRGKEDEQTRERRGRRWVQVGGIQSESREKERERERGREREREREKERERERERERVHTQYLVLCSKEVLTAFHPVLHLLLRVNLYVECSVRSDHLKHVLFASNSAQESKRGHTAMKYTAST